MKIWDLSIKKPITVLMCLACFVVLGLICGQRLKLAFLPTLDFPGLFVVATYPNQNPELLEREVTKPLEEGLSTLKGLKKVSSTTDADSVQVELRFDWGMDLNLARLEAGLKLEELKAKLPKGVRRIEIFSFNTSEIPIVQGRISAPGMDLSENYELLEKHIKQPLERVPGVASVSLGGVEPKEISIELRIRDIEEFKVDVGEIVTALSNDNLTLAAGKINTGSIVFNLRAQGKIDSLEAFKTLKINSQGVRLQDVADVLFEEPPIGYLRHLDHARALAVEVRKESTANIVDVANGARRVIEEEINNDPLLKGINLFIWQDQAGEITGSLDGLKSSGLFGTIFAVIVLFIFLRRLTPTLIVAVAIPISVIGTFVFMYALGYTLNILTMMGLMLAVGMLVDNAVVVLESIYSKRQEGLSIIDATREGTKEVWLALISSTATTVIVFLSLAVSKPTELTVFLKSLGLTICMTLLISLLVSVTLIPLLCSRFLKKIPVASAEASNFLVRFYARILDWCLGKPIRSALVIFLLVLSSAIPFSQLGKFKGQSFRNERIFLDYECKDFFFLSDMEKVVTQYEAYFEQHREAWGLESIYSYMEENSALTVLTLKNKKMEPARYKEIRKELREGLPKIAGINLRFGDDDSQDSPKIAVQLFGTDADVLRGTGEKVVRVLSDVKGLFDLRAGDNQPKKELKVHVNREEASKYKVSPDMISQIFGFTLGSTYLPRFRYGDRESDVSIGLRIEDRATIEDISRMKVANGVPLGALASFEFTEKPKQIERVDRKSNLTVNGTYEGENFDEMKKEVETRLNRMELPPGVSWSWSQRIMDDDDEMADMLLNLLLALLMVYLVMASLFESLVQPVIIFCTIFFSLVGVSWFLLFTRTEFGIMSGIGMLILVGIVVNNGIMLMDRFNHLRLNGSDLLGAVRQAAHDRIRPILMTASTTIIGLVPMAMGRSGAGGAYYFPLARTVIGGLTASTLLTLVGIPVAVLLVYRFFAWAKTKFNKKRGSGVLELEEVRLSTPMA